MFTACPSCGMPDRDSCGGLARDELSPDVLVWRQGHGERIPACDMAEIKAASAARRQDPDRPPTCRRQCPNIRLPGHGPVFWRAFSTCCCFTYRLPWWPAAPDADLRQTGDKQADDVRGRLARRGSRARQHALRDQRGPSKRRARAGPGNNERTAICRGARRTAGEGGIRGERGLDAGYDQRPRGAWR